MNDSFPRRKGQESEKGKEHAPGLASSPQRRHGLGTEPDLEDMSSLARGLELVTEDEKQYHKSI